MTINDRAMLVKLSFRLFNTEREDKKVSNEVCTAKGAESDSGRFTKSLLAKSFMQDLQYHVGKMRNDLLARTLPWSDDGQRILANSGYLPLQEWAKPKIEEFWQLVEKACDGYLDAIDQAKTLRGDLFNENDYPSVEAFRKRFHVTFKFRPVPESDDFRCQLDKDAVDAIRAELDSDLRETLAAGLDETVERIRKLVERMVERLTSYGRDANGKLVGGFHGSLVGNIRELVEILPSLNITGDYRIDSLINDMKRELITFDADELKESPAARKQVAKAASDILDKMKGYGF